MRDNFSLAQLEHFKRTAKARQRANPSRSHAQALDQIAAETGWTSWALLVKHSLAKVNDAINVKARQYPGGTFGVFLVEMEVVDPVVRAKLADFPLAFDLPSAPGWLFRGANPRQHEFGPYIDVASNPRRAVFKHGRWQAILSRNGISDDEIHAHIRATKQPLLADLHFRALEALLPALAGLATTPGGRYRLFFSKPTPAGLQEIDERGYASLDEAKSAELPPGFNKIGIPTDAGWLAFQAPFGWLEPAIRPARAENLRAAAEYVRGHSNMFVTNGPRMATPHEAQQRQQRIEALAGKIDSLARTAEKGEEKGDVTYQQFESVRRELRKEGFFLDRSLVSAVTRDFMGPRQPAS